MPTWQVDIDPNTCDAIAHSGGKTFPPNTLELDPHDGVHWSCQLNGKRFEFKLEWKGPAPPTGVETDTWASGKQQDHSLQHTRDKGTKKHFPYNVTVFNADGSIRKHVDPDMVMDT